MKKQLTVHTRKIYYVSNIAGLIILLAFIVWFVSLAFNEGAGLKSAFLWLAILLALFVPFAIISIFSAMKSIRVTEKGLVISYMFKSHKSEIVFSDVKEFVSTGRVGKPVQASKGLRDSFALTLVDGRVFEFSRSQFDNYDNPKAVTHKAVGGK
jgi:hypothetical protein